MRHPLFLAGAALASFNSASAVGPLKFGTKLLPANCWGGCDDALGYVSFGDVDSTLGYYAGQVASTWTMTSLVACMEEYCTVSERQAGWAQYAEYAQDYGPDVDIGEYAAWELVWSELENITTVNTAESAGMVFNGTVLIDRASWEIGKWTEDTWTTEMYYHHAYGWSMYIIFAAAILVGIVSRLAHNLNGTSSPYQTGAATRAPRVTALGRFNTLVKKHVTTPALVSQRHSIPALWGWATLPTRLEGLFVGAYIIINFVFCFACYWTFDENMYWPGESALQLSRYIADRTGIMAWWNLPLLWVLAGRNDVLLYLTGWSFATANILHRWVARVATILAIVHSAGYTWYAIYENDLAESAAEQYWWMGVIATVAMSLLLGFSVKPFRDRFYEAFLIVHIAFALLVLVTLFYHVKIFLRQYDPWLWACAAIWLFDRVIRIARFALITTRAMWHGDNAVGRLSSTGGLIRIAVKTSFPVRPRAGQHYFVYFPRTIKCWENHPFTLASWNDKGDELSFLMSPREGMTKGLLRRIDKAGGEASLPILLEGPYGDSKPVKRYHHVLLVAGGSGVTAVLPCLHEIAGANAKPCMTRSITLVWAVRSTTYAQDVLENELAMTKFTSSDVKVNVQLHITKETAGETSLVRAKDKQVANAEKAAEALDDDSNGDGVSHDVAVPCIQIIHGRPEMTTILHQYLISQAVGAETMAVVSCGPARMMDQMRAAVVDAYGHGPEQVRGGALEYFEEGFSW